MNQKATGLDAQYNLDGDLVKQAVDGAKMGVWLFDIATGISVWNEALYDIMGGDKNQKIKFDLLSDFTHPDD